MSESTAKIRRIFTGTYPVGVDKQRRLTMPRAWRLSSDTAATQFYIMPGRNNRLQIVTEERMGALFDTLDSISVANGDNIASFTDIASRIQAVTLDQQGRFALNPDLAAYAGITDKAVFLGSITCGTLVSAQGADSQPEPKASSFDLIQGYEEAVRKARAGLPQS